MAAHPGANADQGAAETQGRLSTANNREKLAGGINPQMLLRAGHDIFLIHRRRDALELLRNPGSTRKETA